MTTVAVLDYGMGNLHSVAKAIEHVGASRVEVTNDPARVRAADRIVLPGQGAMRDCMAEMKHYGVDAEVREIIGSKPLLGICVGMQALLAHSEENNGVDGLGIYPGDVKFFGTDRVENGEKLKVPHMGWNRVQHGEHPLWAGIAQGARFYYVHSYYVQPRDAALVQGTSDYPQPFVCAAARDKLFAVQFHPEKSAQDGLRLLQNFVNWNPV